MRKMSSVLLFAALLSSQSLFAADQDQAASMVRPCAPIAKACLKAGYVRAEKASKKIWQDCMKPIILGQNVASVTVDAATVKACRTTKIDALQKELVEFQKADSSSSS